MLEFLEEGHLYLLDGIIVPSVSEMLHFIFPDKYKNIPKEILSAKAEYGTKIHEAIEKAEKTGEVIELDYIQKASFEQYLKLKEKYEIQVINQEEIIYYKDKYAGRFDMIAYVKNNYSLCDIKTTTELDREYLSWQLSLYAYAYDKLNIGNHFEKLYAIWLPKKELGHVVEIPRKSDDEIQELLKKYEEFKNEIKN